MFSGKPSVLDSGKPVLVGNAAPTGKVANATKEANKTADISAELNKQANDSVQKNKFWTEKVEFSGVKVFARNDTFDPSLITNWKEKGRVISGTNLERMASGRSPVGVDGKPVNLHHMLQSNDSPIAEMTQTFHQQNSKVIHINPNTIPSGIDRSAFDSWKKEYWINRSKTYRGN